MNNIHGKLISFDEARQYLEAQTDPQLRELLLYGFTTLVGGIGLHASNSPGSPVDCLYFLQVLASIFRDRELIRQFLNGERIRLGISEDDLHIARDNDQGDS